jgi:hypothetical protein
MNEIFRRHETRKRRITQKKNIIKVQKLKQNLRENLKIAK